MNLPSGRILTGREIDAMMHKIVTTALDGMSTDWSCGKILGAADISAQDMDFALAAFKPIAEQVINRTNATLLRLVASGVNSIVARYGG